jgi:Wiskott-Aldrich syndrome protein
VLVESEPGHDLRHLISRSEAPTPATPRTRPPPPPSGRPHGTVPGVPPPNSAPPDSAGRRPRYPSRPVPTTPGMAPGAFPDPPREGAPATVPPPPPRKTGGSGSGSSPPPGSGR